MEGDATGWTEHKTRDGYTCYYDNQTGEYSWEYPEGWTGVSSDLSREEIQVKKEEREGEREREREREVLYRERKGEGEKREGGEREN